MTDQIFTDRVLTCRDCSNPFTFEAGEQRFFSENGLKNTPARCPDCRAARRQRNAQ